MLAALIEGAQELTSRTPPRYSKLSACASPTRPPRSPRVCCRRSAVSSSSGGIDAPTGAALAPVVDALRDESSHARRRSALTVLAQLVRATGDSAAPYAEYPELLPTLLALLRSGGSLRRARTCLARSACSGNWIRSRRPDAPQLLQPREVVTTARRRTNLRLSRISLTRSFTTPAAVSALTRAARPFALEGAPRGDAGAHICTTLRAPLGTCHMWFRWSRARSNG